MRDQYQANDQIRFQTVRLIDEAGQNVGVVSTSDAQRMAYNRGFDLVVISPTAQPPVAKICDYNKFIYDQKQLKKEQDKKLRENAIVTKEIQLRPVIGEHDLDVKINHAKEWLQDNCKIKVIVKFRGREMAHKDLGFAVIQSFISKLDNCKVERQPEMNSNTIIAMIGPNSKAHA